MISLKGQQQNINIRRLNENDYPHLVSYLHGLSENSKRKFGPHTYDLMSIEEFYKEESCKAFIAEISDTSEIIAYAILKTGYLAHDLPRLENYGLQLSDTEDATFAPSVADAWQSKGLGSEMFKHILSENSSRSISRIILWGGVQSSNHKAIRFYEKFGFEQLGVFEYYGMNQDMILRLNNS